MSVVIFGDLYKFPDGGAATNRVYTYAKGFIENGVKVCVICFTNDYLEKNNGIIEGISYFNPFGQQKRSKYFIIRRLQKISKYINTYYRIKKINKDDKIIAINSWSNLLFTHLFAFLLAKLFSTKLIIECSEHPLRYFKNGIFIKKQGILKFYIETFISDGVFCISRFLIDFHRSKGINIRKLFLVPSTVDPSRFLESGEKPITKPYIGYFGSLTFDRDNVDVLIKAYARFSKLHSEVYLILGGFCSESEKSQIQELIIQLDIQQQVQIIGYLPRQEITRYITHSDVLVIVRSENLESQASFPSKLTEFLATSKPVVTVNIGEIPFYLTDGVDAFLVQPGNDVALAEKLNFVFNNYEIAEKVGRKGKELTNTIFNYNYQAKRMIGFINSLNN